MSKQPKTATQDYETGVWQNTELRDKALKDSGGDSAKAMEKYHADMVQWVDQNCCDLCGDFIGDENCYCAPCYDE